MICTCCGREGDPESMFLSDQSVGSMIVTGGVCPECKALAEAMQEVWEGVPEPKPTHFAETVGHVMRMTIEHNVP